MEEKVQYLTRSLAYCPHSDFHSKAVTDLAWMFSMLLFFKNLSLAFSALLPLINPLRSALVFFGLVGIAPAMSSTAWQEKSLLSFF
jgi:hypothetical protein